MRAVAAMLIVLGLPVHADVPREQPIQSELSRLAGTWEGYVVMGRGENPDSGPVHMRLVIEEDRIRAFDLSSPNQQSLGSGTFRIDPARALPVMDATGILLSAKRSRSFMGVYQLDGDTLRWCVDNQGKERPTEFRTAGGKYLIILKRRGGTQRPSESGPEEEASGHSG